MPPVAIDSVYHVCVASVSLSSSQLRGIAVDGTYPGEMLHPLLPAQLSRHCHFCFITRDLIVTESTWSTTVSETMHATLP